MLNKWINKWMQMTICIQSSVVSQHASRSTLLLHTTKPWMLNLPFMHIKLVNCHPVMQSLEFIATRTWLTVAFRKTPHVVEFSFQLSVLIFKSLGVVALHAKCYTLHVTHNVLRPGEMGHSSKAHACAGLTL